MKPDVIVVGGGPAGAIAALLLARAGVKVRLFDRARFPRRKLCGDTINPGALATLKRLGLGRAASADALHVEGMLVAGGGTAVRAAYPPGVRGLAIARAVFDARLLEAAERAGVDVCQGTLVQGPLCEEAGRENRVIGVRMKRRDDEDAVERAPLVIAAEGRHSRTAFALGLSRYPDRPRRWAIGAYYSDVDEVGPFGEMHIRRGHYFGVAAVPGGLVNVCLVTPERTRVAAPEESLRGLLQSEPMLRERFSRARRVSPVAVLGPLAVESRAAGMDGLLLAGDAAGFVDPMTGDGLRFAIRGGELAAGAALAALARPSAAAHIILERSYHEFARKRAFNRALRRLVDSPRVVRAAAIGARVAPFMMQYVVNVAGDLRAA